MVNAIIFPAWFKLFLSTTSLLTVLSFIPIFAALTVYFRIIQDMALIKVKLEELEKKFASKPVVVVTEKVSTNNVYLANLLNDPPYILFFFYGVRF